MTRFERTTVAWCDGSPASLGAVAAATREAARRGTGLVLLVVTGRAASSGAATSAEDSAAATSPLVAAALDLPAVEERAVALASAADATVPLEVVVAVDAPPAWLLDLAQRTDLVVMRGHGRLGLPMLSGGGRRGAGARRDLRLPGPGGRRPGRHRPGDRAGPRTGGGGGPGHGEGLGAGATDRCRRGGLPQCRAHARARARPRRDARAGHAGRRLAPMSGGPARGAPAARGAQPSGRQPGGPGRRPAEPGRAAGPARRRRRRRRLPGAVPAGTNSLPAGTNSRWTWPGGRSAAGCSRPCRATCSWCHPGRTGRPCWTSGRGGSTGSGSHPACCGEQRAEPLAAQRGSTIWG